MRKSAIATLACLSVLVVLLFFSRRGERGEKPDAAAPGKAGFSYPTDRLDEAHDGNIIADIARGRIDLAEELVRLKRSCVKAGVTERMTCNERIRKEIRNLRGKDADRLLGLFEEYLAFEEKMLEGRILPQNFAALPEVEKYRAVKKARREALGEENTRLLFGLQEARVALTEEQQKLVSGEYARLPADERLRLYEDRKKEILGLYYEIAAERETAESRLAVETALRQNDIANMSDADQERLAYDLRVKYFGEVEAQRMSEEDAREKRVLAEAGAKVDQFLAAEEEYLSRNGHLTEDERRAGVDTLREKILGK